MPGPTRSSATSSASAPSACRPSREWDVPEPPPYPTGHGLLDEETEATMRKRVAKVVADALEQAEAAAEPSPETAFDHVYKGVRMPDFRAAFRDADSSPSRAVKTTP